MNGPFEVELKIRVTNGEQTAVANYQLPVGIYPTPDEIRKALSSTLSEVHKSLGEDWRLQTRCEFTNEVVSDRYGGLTPEFATKTTWDEPSSPLAGDTDG